MTDFHTRARALISTARRCPEKNWSPTRIAVLNVFDGFPERAFPIDRIEAIAEALEQFKPVDTQRELLKLLREKVLRSRRQGRVRLYEVNA
jgi:hypothetical protein